MQQEVWKKVAGFSGFYWVSSFGRVKKIYPNGNIYFIKEYSNKKRYNYVYVNLEVGKERKNWLLHRLVAKYFIPNPERKQCINHKDFNVINNEVNNLEWVTYKENMLYSKKAGRLKYLKGEECGRAVLLEKIVRKIIEEVLKNKISYKRIAQKFNTNYSNVAHIMRGTRWGHIRKEYRKHKRNSGFRSHTKEML